MKPSTKVILLFTVFCSVFLSGHAQDERFNPNQKDKISEDEIKANADAFSNAYKYVLLENVEEARKAFETIVATYAWDAASRYELARIYISNNQILEAVGLAEEACALEPTNKWYADLLSALYEQTDQPGKMLALLERSLEATPNDVHLLEKAAAAAILNHESEKAISFFDQIERINGVSEAVSLQKHRIYADVLNKPKSAVKELVKLSEAFPDENRYRVMIAEYYTKTEDFRKALEIYEELLKRDPDDVYPAISMADLYNKSGQRDEMMAVLRKVFASSKLGGEPKLQVFLTLFTPEQIYKDEPKQALELVEIMLGVHPSDPKLMAIYGELLYKADRDKEARVALEKSLSIDSSRYFVWEQMLFVLSSLNDSLSLESYSSRCRLLFPFQPIPFLFEGMMKARKSEHTLAAKLWEEGKSLVTNNTGLAEQFAMFLGDTYHQLKDFVKSDSAYEEALRYNPDNVYVLNNYSYYLAVRGIQLERAERLSQKAISIEPNNATYLDTYAWVLYKLKRYDESLFWIEKTLAVGENPGATLYDHAGDILFRLNRVEEAVGMWQKALEQDASLDEIKLKIERRKIDE